MDLLYSRYSNPMEFMRLYMEQGRFGEFVNNIIDMENKRRKEQAEKEEEDKFWQMYLHSASEKSFIDWKKEVLRGTQNRENQKKEHSSKEEIINIINNSTKLLDDFRI